MTVDFPEPVGPTSANSSTPSKSISVGSRNAPKPCDLEPDRPHRLSSSSSRRREQRDEPVVLDALLGEVRGEQVLRAAAAACRRAGASSPTPGASIRTSTTRSPSSARTSSARPARAGSVTRTRSQAPPRSSLAGDRLQLVERPGERAQLLAGGERRPARSTPAGPGAASTRSTCLPAPASPKSTWIGEPEYQIGAPPGIFCARWRWPSAT